MLAAGTQLDSWSHCAYSFVRLGSSVARSIAKPLTFGCALDVLSVSWKLVSAALLLRSLTDSPLLALRRSELYRIRVVGLACGVGGVVVLAKLPVPHTGPAVTLNESGCVGSNVASVLNTRT